MTRHQNTQAIDEFFGAGQTVFIEARSEHGHASDVQSRHSAGVMGRALAWLKDSAAPVTGSLAALAVAGALSLAPVPAQAGSSHAKLSTLAASSSAGLSAPATDQSAVEPSGLQKLIDAYEAKKKASGTRINETEFGMSQRAAQALSWSAISPSARQNVRSLDVTDENMLELESISPSMASLKNDKNQAVCIMQVGGYNTEMSKVFRQPIESMTERDAVSLRRVVLVHEAAHCEQTALVFAHNAKLETNFAGHMREVAEGFQTKLPNGKTIDYSTDAIVLMGERYADSKAVLFLSKMHLGSLSQSSTDGQRDAALNEFKQDMFMMKKLRVNERQSLSSEQQGFNDHDTLHVVSSLESVIVENAANPAQWKVWSEKHLGDDQMAFTAGSIALGSLLDERQEIAVSKITEHAEEIQLQINNAQETKNSYTLLLEQKQLASVDAGTLFDTKKNDDGQENSLLGARDYIDKAYNKYDEDAERALLASPDNGERDPGRLSKEQSEQIDHEMYESFPALKLALAAVDRQQELLATEGDLTLVTQDIDDMSKSLKQTRQVLASSAPAHQAIGDGLSDASKSFSMQGYSFWSQAKGAASDMGSKSFLQEKVDRPVTAPVQTLAPTVMKLLKAQPTTPRASQEGRLAPNH